MGMTTTREETLKNSDDNGKKTSEKSEERIWDVRTLHRDERDEREREKVKSRERRQNHLIVLYDANHVVLSVDNSS